MANTAKSKITNAVKSTSPAKKVSTNTSSVKIDSKGDLFKDNPLLFIDATKSNKADDFPFMFMVIGSCVFSVSFNYNYVNNTAATTKAVTNSNNGVSEYIVGFDITVNGYVITRRRYTNPGASVSDAFEDARAIMDKIYEEAKKRLEADASEKDYKFTTLTSYPLTNNDSKVSELKKKRTYYNGNNSEDTDIF